MGANITISQDSYLCTASHDISKIKKPLIFKPIFIGDSAWVAARAIVLPGVRVGDGAVIAAGAVVVKDVEPWTVVGGNPAKVIKKRELL
jgi:putative colanic acid biosynthesis acetyltransferase WcaF